MANARMFGRQSRLTPHGYSMGRYRCRYRPSCYWETTWSGRSSQGQVSLVSPMTQGGQRAHGTIQPTNNHHAKGGLSPRTEHDPRSTGVRDAAAWWPLSLCCQGSRTLDVSASVLSVHEHGCELDPPITLRRWRGGAC